MLINTVKYFFDQTSGRSSAFCYRGPFIEKFTNSILDIAATSSQEKRREPSAKRKVSFMLVECFQNILKHSESAPIEKNVWQDDGMFSFSDTGTSFSIDTINLILTQDADKIAGLVSQVNSLSGEELKQFYLHHLKTNELSAKSGAGLGLIELARKSGQKILHKTQKLNADFSLFQQRVALNESGETNHTGDKELDLSKDVYDRLIHDDVFLFFKGEFSQKSILPLLDLVEHNIQPDSRPNVKSRRAGHVLVEILQNIAKYTSGETETNSSGIFMIGRQNGSLFILAGNEVNISEKLFLEEKLEYLTSLDDDELRELHKHAMRASLRFENKTRSGLGLIEVVKASTSKLEYEFFESGHNKFLFVINVKV